jgi:Peptidase A4 family
VTRLFRPAILASLVLLFGAGFAGSAAVASAGAHTRAVVLKPGGPLVRAHIAGDGSQTISLNWSGYAATAPAGKKFRDVSASFVQPSITCTGKFTYTTNWVGLDGFKNGTVEQDGTAAYCGGGPAHMTPVYYAWIEMFPKPSVTVFRVNPGDHINASVRYSDGKFHLAIADATSRKHAATSAACARCARASAEWIIERPEVCSAASDHCFLTKLADFHKTTMEASYARLSGSHATAPGGFAGNYAISATGTFRHKPGFITLDWVSALKGPEFSVTWSRSGTAVPST